MTSRPDGGDSAPDAGVASLLRLLTVVGTTPLPLTTLISHRDLLPRDIATLFGEDGAPTPAMEAIEGAHFRHAGVALSERARLGTHQDADPRSLAEAVTLALTLLVAELPAEAGEPDEWGRVDPLVDHALATVKTFERLDADGAIDIDLRGRLAGLAATTLQRVGVYFIGRGRYVAAKQVLDAAAALGQDADASYATLRGIIQRSLAVALNDLGESAASRRSAKRAIRIHELEGEPLEVGLDEIVLARSLNGLQRFDTALERAYKAVATLTEAGAPPVHVERAHREVAYSLLHAGRADEARLLLEQRDLERRIIGSFGPRSVDSIMHHGALGWALAECGDLEAGQQMLERALERAQAVVGDDHPDVGVLLSNLAPICDQTGDPQRARELLETSLSIAERVLPPDHPVLVTRHGKLAVILGRQGDLDAAIVHWHSAVRLTEHLSGAGRSLALALDGLAETQTRQGDLLAAESSYQRAVYVAETVEDDPKLLARLRWRLAEIRVQLGSTSSAIRTITALASTPAEDHPDGLSPTMVRLAAGYAIHQLGSDIAEACQAVSQGRSGARIARQIDRIATSLASESFDDENLENVVRAAVLAAIAGDMTGARSAMERVARDDTGDVAPTLVAMGWEAVTQTVPRRSGGSPHPIEILEPALPDKASRPATRAALLVLLADHHLADGAIDAAVDALSEAADIQAETGDLTAVVSTLGRLASVQWTDDRDADAIATQERRLELADQLTDRTAVAIQVRCDLAYFLNARGQFDRALEFSSAAVDDARRTDEKALLANALLSRGRTLEALHRPLDALAVYRERLDLVRAFPHPDHVAEGVTLHDLADVHLTLEEVDEAVDLYEQALAHKQRVPTRTDVTSTQLSLARAYRRQGDEQAALAMLRQRFTLLSSSLDRDRTAEFDTLLELADLEHGAEGPQAALSILEGLIERARELGDPGRLARALCDAGAMALETGNDDQAGQWAQEAVTLLDDLPSDRGELVFAHTLVARAGRADEVVVFASLRDGFAALRRAHEQNPDLETAFGQILTDTCFALGQLELATAVERMLRELDLDESLIDPTDFASAKLRRTRQLIASGRLQEAPAALQELTIEPGADPELAIDWLELGRRLQFAGKDKEAIDALDRALVLSQPAAQAHTRVEAAIHFSLGDSKRAIGDIDAAIASYRTAVDKLQGGPDPGDLASAMMGLARAYCVSGAFDDAVQLLTERDDLLATSDANVQARVLGWHDLGTTHRFAGRLADAADAFRTGLQLLEPGGRPLRLTAETSLSLALVLYRMDPGESEERSALMVRVRALLMQMGTQLERSSPKDAAVPVAPRARRRVRAGEELTTSTSRLPDAAVAALVALLRRPLRVPPPGEAALTPEIHSLLSEADLITPADSSTMPALTRAGERAGSRLLDRPEQRQVRSPRVDEAYLQAQLAISRDDHQAARRALTYIASENAPRHLGVLVKTLLALCDGEQPVPELQAELDGWVAETEDTGRLTLAAHAALDGNIPELAQKALLQITDTPQDLVPDVGLLWHDTAVAFEVAAELDAARSAYRTASSYLRDVHIDFAVTALRHEADMLRAAGQRDVALEMELNTPFAPRASSSRALTANALLRTARAEAILGDRVAARGRSWSALAAMRFVQNRGIEEPPKPRRGRKARADLADLSPGAIALVELLREDELDAPRRGLRPGLLLTAHTLDAAYELEHARLAELHVLRGWMRLTASGRATAADLGARFLTAGD